MPIVDRGSYHLITGFTRVVFVAAMVLVGGPLILGCGYVFLFCWATAWRSWGWLLGLSLGWVPAAIITALAVFVAYWIMFVWTAIIVLVGRLLAPAYNALLPLKHALIRQPEIKEAPPE